MSPNDVKATTPQSPTFEEFQKQLQTATMNNARMMLLSLLSSEPPVSEWPADVRTYLSRAFMRAASLFIVEGESDVH